MQVAPGVYRLPISLYSPPLVVDPKPTANVYVLRGKDGCMLIDSGWDTKEAYDGLKSQMAEIGLGLKDIKKVAYTHSHPDHFGQAGLFKEYGTTWQAAHRLEMEYICNKFSRTDDELGKTEVQWYISHGVPAKYLEELRQAYLRMHHMIRFSVPSVALEEDDVIEFTPFHLKVLLTPGHSLGHICYYEPRLKLLFCGDHLTPKQPPHIPFYSSYKDNINPIGSYLTTLKPLEALDVELVLPAHGHEFTGFKRRLDQTKRQLEQRNEETFDVLDGQQMTAFQVNMQLHPHSEWNKMPTVQKRGQMVETVAQLQALKLDGRVETVLNDGLILYKRKG